MAELEKTDLLRQIRDEILNLKGSPLYRVRVAAGVHPVIGEGNHRARFMFIGEAPGRNEAATGRPLCGAAGKVLDALFVSTDGALKREDVYVTNIVKDRPPQNRDPLPEEIAAYAPFLERQIEIIRPGVIVALGRFSMDYLFRKFMLEEFLKNISQMHGKVFDAKAPYGDIKLVALYHPAVAVYNPNVKDELIKDFAVLKTL